jgi:hypothetical protein
MPNIAFLSLIYLLLAVPGFLYRSSYYSGDFTRNLLPRSWTDELGKAIVLSVPFHLFWIGIFEWGKHCGAMNYTMTFETVLRLMAAEYSVHDYSFHGIVSRFYQNKFYVIAYYLLVLITAVLSGWGARALVWNLELDVRWSWLRYRSDWLYRIMGRGAMEGVRSRDIDALIDILSEQDTGAPGKSMLYQGLAAGYTAEEDGTLRDIILTDVKRTAGEKAPDGKVKWSRIPGRFFVMSYDKVRNMNITYEQHPKMVLEQISNLPNAPLPSAPPPVE